MQIPSDQTRALALLELPRAGSVRVSVTDSGAGLSEQQLAEICAEGVQFSANELQAGQGSGLGLFISKGLVEQHGGKMTVTSEGLGKGATFTVELPLFRRPQEDVESSDYYSVRSDNVSINSTPYAAGSAVPPGYFPLLPTSLDRFPPPPPPSPSAVPASADFSAETVSIDVSVAGAGADVQKAIRRILVVDDAASNRKMLIRLLTAKGYVCEQAEDGQQGVEAYQSMCVRGEPPLAIVMDFEMPVMNGPIATRKLREMGCAIRIIGVTGNMLPEDVAHFKQQGADEVLGKPLNLQLFEECLM